MKLSPQWKKSERGMALLLVLVTVMALTLIIGALWESSEPGWEENTLERARYQAGLLAESGIAVALHPDIERGDRALRHQFDPGRSYEVRISSEGARIPVNGLVDEVWREVTVELFVSWGIDTAAASEAVDSLADWIDADEETLPNGAENGYYAGLNFDDYPPNTTFGNLEEMLFVRGMEVIARYQPLWRDYFTVYGDGLIDLNTAPWEIILALSGTTEDSALNFVAVRNGDDGLEGTEDDYTFEDVGEVQALLGLSDSEWEEISGYVSLTGGTLRIESTGRIGEFEETRVVLASEPEDDGQPYTVLARFRN